MTDPRSDADSRRAAWLGALGRAASASLASRADALISSHDFEMLRAPEVGLTMIRARIGNTGDRFNLGEATITRCAVRHHPPDGSTTLGVGYLLGRDEARCLRIARLDALLQRQDLCEYILREIVAPLIDERSRSDRRDAARAQASRVRFFALAPDVAM